MTGWLMAEMAHDPLTPFHELLFYLAVPSMTGCFAITSQLDVNFAFSDQFGAFVWDVGRMLMARRRLSQLIEHILVILFAFVVSARFLFLRPFRFIVDPLDYAPLHFCRILSNSRDHPALIHSVSMQIICWRMPVGASAP